MAKHRRSIARIKKELARIKGKAVQGSWWMHRDRNEIRVFPNDQVNKDAFLGLHLALVYRYERTWVDKTTEFWIFGGESKAQVFDPLAERNRWIILVDMDEELSRL